MLVQHLLALLKRKEILIALCFIVFLLLISPFLLGLDTKWAPAPTISIPVTVTPHPFKTDKTIDMLDYFLSDHPGSGLTGTHPLSQTIDGKSAYYVKWAAENYEYYTWDDKFIYLREDHSGAPVQPYTFTPGIWMGRYMEVGDSLNYLSGENTIQFFDKDCQPVSTNSGPYHYSMTLQSHITDFDAGGDLGIQDIIVLVYDYRPAGAQNYEKFYYSKEWGWIKWENVDGTGTVVQTSVFNKHASHKDPNKEVTCLTN